MVNIKSDINWWYKTSLSFLGSGVIFYICSGGVWTPDTINDSFSVAHLTRCCDNCPHVFISKLSNYSTHNGLDTIGYFASVSSVRDNFVRPQKRCCESPVAWFIKWVSLNWWIVSRASSPINSAIAFLVMFTILILYLLHASLTDSFSLRDSPELEFSFSY
jgi:hypothetical protein